MAALADIARVHPDDLIERLLAAVPESGYVGIDADTIVSPGSGEAALRAAGAVCAAVDAVMAGEAGEPLFAGGPPGPPDQPPRPLGVLPFQQGRASGRARRATPHFERGAGAWFSMRT